MKNIILLSCLFISLSSHAIEFTASAGYQTHDGDWETVNLAFDNQDYSDSGYHLGFSIKNHVGKNKTHLIGAGIDVDSILDDRVIGYRAIDYQYIFSEKFRMGGFFGAATIDTGLPQNGYYLGINTSYLLNKKISIAAEVRHGNGLARDRALENDPVEQDPNQDTPDIFLDYTAIGLQINWHF